LIQSNVKRFTKMMFHIFQKVGDDKTNDKTKIHVPGDVNTQ
jgi:hypothetical protein